MGRVTTQPRRVGVLPAASVIAALLATLILAPPASAAPAAPQTTISHLAAAHQSVATNITIDQPGPITYLHTWVATGTLSSSESVTNREIDIYRPDMGSGSTQVHVGHGVTDAQGRFAIPEEPLWFGMWYTATYAGGSDLAASQSSVLVQVAAEKVAISAHAAYGKLTSISVIVTAGGQVPLMHGPEDRQYIDVQYFTPDGYWHDVMSVFVADASRADIFGHLTILAKPSTTAVTYRAQLFGLAPSGMKNELSPVLLVAASRPGTAITAKIVRRGQAGYVAGKFTIRGGITSQLATMRRHHLSIRIFRQRAGARAWILVGHATTSSKGIWTYTGPNYLGAKLQARLAGTPAAAGSVSIPIVIVKT